MITEYDISPWTEKYPDPWIRLIEYFPYCKQAQILKNRRYHLVQKRATYPTENTPCLSLEVSGNFYNDERIFWIKAGGTRKFTFHHERLANRCFELIS